MASVLVDTSVWVDFLRKGEGPASTYLDLCLEENGAILCGIVELELLQGVRPSEKTALLELLSPLPYADTDRRDFQKAGELLASLRSNGIQIPATDGLIAALCLRLQLPLLTLDGHFDHVRGIQKIKLPS